MVQVREVLALSVLWAGAVAVVDHLEAAEGLREVVDSVIEEERALWSLASGRQGVALVASCLLAEAWALRMGD